jgi:hypothetical protein
MFAAHIAPLLIALVSNVLPPLTLLQLRASVTSPPNGGSQNFLWTMKRRRDIFFAMAKGAVAGTDKSERSAGDARVNGSENSALGLLHGFGIARRVEQVNEDVLTLNEGTVYTSLLRLQQQGWIDSEWGTSENNRRGQVLLDHQARTEATGNRD